MLNMALFCKENHCGSCQKAFCCFSCRSKHENIAHQKIGTESVRKVLAPIRNGTFQSNNSLARIPESAQLKSFPSKIPINDRKKNSIFIYNDPSYRQLNEQLKIHDKDDKSNKCVKDSFTEPDYDSTNDVLIDDTSIHQENKENRPPLPEKSPNSTVDVGNDLSSFVIFSEEKKENIPPDQILDTSNYHITTAGNTPPRITTEELENYRSADSVIEVESSQDENSSIYCACSENLVKSDVNSNWKSALSAMCDLSNNEIKEISENSSIYFACSEFSSKELSAKIYPKAESVMDKGFQTFEENSKLASTKLQMTESFAKEVFEFENDTKTECDSTEYLTPSLQENTESGIIWKNESVEIDNSTETITSNFCSEPVSIKFDECSSINIEPPEQQREYLSEWARALATQTSLDSSISSLRDISGSDKENCGNAIELLPPAFEHVPVITEQESLPIAQPTFVINGDHSFWQSFSSSLQRAYNSTKEICNNIGRKNKSKRGLDDISEEQPKPKRPKILCRPPIRENPKVIFRQDGDFRRPVIGFDKGTQTDGDSIFF